MKRIIKSMEISRPGDKASPGESAAGRGGSLHYSA